MSCPISNLLNDEDVSPSGSSRPARGSSSNTAPLPTPPQSQNPSFASSVTAEEFAKEIVKAANSVKTGKKRQRASSEACEEDSSPWLCQLTHQPKRGRVDDNVGLDSAPYYPLDPTVTTSHWASLQQQHIVAVGQDDKNGPWSTSASKQDIRPIFNLLAGLTTSFDILVEISSYLSVEDLLSLYCTSRPFHSVVRRSFTRFMTSIAVTHAPNSDKTSPYVNYPSLCMRDPNVESSKIPSGGTCVVPTFKWLQMVVYREKMVRQILTCLALEGHRLPAVYAPLAIKKLWALMDLGTNKARIEVIEDKTRWTDEDIFVSTMFFVKLDMRFVDPIESGGETALRRLLMGQKSMTTLCKTLKREELKVSTDLMRMVARYNYKPSKPEHKDMSIMGITPEELGKICLEGYGTGKERLFRPDELVLNESVRRNMHLQHRYLDCVLYGYADPVTFEKIKEPTLAEVNGMSTIVNDWNLPEEELGEADEISVVAVDEGTEGEHPTIPDEQLRGERLEQALARMDLLLKR